MSLSFLTQDQRFIFVDHKTHQIIHPMNTFAGSTYDVYVVVTNSYPVVAKGVKTNVWHSGLGETPRDRLCGLTQPPITEIPASVFGIAGQATIAFQFRPSKGCRGTLHIKIEPNGATIRQEVTVHEPFDRQAADPPNHRTMLFRPMTTGTLRGLRILAVSLK